MTTPAFIFARGGSKGIPLKNLQLLGGKPLIAWSIEIGLACPSIDRVIVSTDHQEIAEVASDAGAEVPFLRPHELAGDNAPEWLSYHHAIYTMREIEPGFGPPVFLSLPPTSPLRSVEDVERCIARLDEGDCDIVVAGCRSSRSPYFNMVQIDGRGHASLVCPPSKALSRRQDAPACFDLTTVAFAGRTDFVLGAGALFDGTVGLVEVPPERAVDIDEPIDLQLAEVLLRSR